MVHRYLFSILFLSIAFAFSACGVSSDVQSSDIALTLNTDNSTIVFDDTLHASTTIRYTLANNSEKDSEGKSYVLNILKQKPGEISPELLHEEKVVLKPHQEESYIFEWNIDGIPAGCENGEEYELFTELYEEQDDSFFSVASSDHVKVMYSIPEMLP